MNRTSIPAAIRRSAGFQTCCIAGLQACRALGRTAVLRDVARRSRQESRRNSRQECLRYGLVGSSRMAQDISRVTVGKHSRNFPSV